MVNNGKARTGRKRNYGKDLSRAEKNCARDIAAAAMLLVLSGCALAWTMLGKMIPEVLLPYRYALGSASISAILYALLKIIEGISEKKACRSITRGSVYAVRLSEEQQKLISRTLARQSAKEHFLCYSFILALLTAILATSYVKRGNSSSLIVLSAAAVTGFCMTLIAYVRDIVRTSSKDGFCTVSERGIIQAGKVYPFRAENRDVTEMIRFDDCYSVRFITAGVLGLMVNKDFPLPKEGSVSRELIGADEEPVLLSALKPISARVVEGPYRQLPFEVTVFSKDEEEDCEVIPDKSIFLRILAYAAVLALIVSVMISAGIIG